MANNPEKPSMQQHSGTNVPAEIDETAANGVASQRSSNPNTYVVEAAKSHKQTFILLHGLGSNGEQFGQEFLATAKLNSGAKLQEFLRHAKFVFPTARRRRSTAFSRSFLTQWFDIASLRDPAIRKDVQYQGLSESAKAIREIIQAELRTLSSENIILGGLSQGCAMSLAVLLSLDHKLGGFIGMSGWLPLEKDITHLLEEDAEQDNENDPFANDDTDEGAIQDPMIMTAGFLRDALSLDPAEADLECTALNTPSFLGHGEDDPKIPWQLGDSAAQTLGKVGMDVTWRLYPNQGHWYKIPDEIDDILDFLKNRTNAIPIVT